MDRLRRSGRSGVAPFASSRPPYGGARRTPVYAASASRGTAVAASSPARRPSVTAASPRWRGSGEAADEILDPRRGREAELALDARLEGAVVTHGLAGVALGQVHPDQRAVGALPQRIGPDRGEPRLDRLPVAAGLGEPIGERLEGVRAKLAQPLALLLDPLVVPVRQEVALERPALDRELLGEGLRIEQAPRRRDERPHVDDDLPAQAHVRRRGLDDLRLRPAQAPQRGAEVRARPLLARVE